MQEFLADERAWHWLLRGTGAVSAGDVTTRPSCRIVARRE